MAGARRRAERFVLPAHETIALYGAGQLGRHVLARLRRIGIEPVAFADDTPTKQGQVVDGLTVLRPAEVAARCGAHTLFVVTIFNPAASFLAVERRLQAQVADARVVSFLSLAWRYPAQFLPHYQFVLPADVLVHAADIRRAFQLFSDEESRRQFVAQLRFRLWLDYGALPASAPAAYFAPDVLPVLPPDIIFVDCGAFDGDTLRTFLARQGDRFRAVHAFEPDARNCARLRAYVACLGAQMAERIHVYHAGVGAAHTTLRFNSAGDMSSSFSPTGDREVEVVPVQDVIAADDGAPLYLKFDVEGAEWAALAGCARLLERAQPMLALSVYHRPDDLWALPLYIAARTRAYRFYLRTQGQDGMDVICYALPPTE